MAPPFISVLEIYKTLARDKATSKIFYFEAPDFSKSWTAAQVWQYVLNGASVLRAHGVEAGEHVGILAPSSERWEIANLSILLLRAVVVGLDPHESDYRTPVKTCRIQKIIYDGAENLSKLSSQLHDQEVQLISLKEILDQVLEMPAAAAWSENQFPGPQDRATVIFTSGTTAEPKGIAYQHAQLSLAVSEISRAFPEFRPGMRTVCWLPLASLFQRIINLVAANLGAEVFFVEQPLQVIKYLPNIRPHIFVSVPRLYEKLQAGIHDKIQMSPWPIRALFSVGLKIGRIRSRWIQRRHQAPRLLNLAWWGFDRLIFARIREVLGGEILFALSGSAALRLEVLEFFHSLGILILEAYGTSENIVPICCNRPLQFKLGSVGQPLIPGSVEFSSAGQVMVKGPGVFSGYLNAGDVADRFSGEHYLTGDLGFMDADGFVFLRGRMSDVFKTSTGRKISSKEIEAKFKEIPYVDTAVALGESRKAPVVLVTMDLQSLSHCLRIPLEQIWDLAQGQFNREVRSLVIGDLNLRCSELAVHQRPMGVLILPRRLTIESKEVTPNLKLRRAYIEQRFAGALDDFYNSHNTFRDEVEVVFLGVGRRDRRKTLTPQMIDTLNLGVWSRALIVFGVVARVLALRIRMRFSSLPSTYYYWQIGQILQETLGHLKGPMQKVGQIISYVAEDVPAEIKDELKALLYDSPPVDPLLIRTIVERELNRPIIEVFSEWNDVPHATASVGQLHVARLRTGEKVLVKVLLPGIRKIVTSDMRILELLAPLVRAAWKTANVNENLKELRTLIEAECDLKSEAENQIKFRSVFEDDPSVIIPRVFLQFCTSEMMVSEFIEGLSFDEFIATASPEARNQAAKIIWAFVARSVNKHCMFNADPHPGNYIFCDGKVAFVDFGFVKKWRPEFVQNWKDQSLAGMRNDLAEFTAASKKLGIHTVKGEYDYARLLKSYREIIYRAWMVDEDFQFTHDFLKSLLREIFIQQIAVKDLHVPVEFLAISRLFWGVNAVMADMNAECNFHRLTVPFLQAKNQTSGEPS